MMENNNTKQEWDTTMASVHQYDGEKGIARGVDDSDLSEEVCLNNAVTSEVETGLQNTHWMDYDDRTDLSSTILVRERFYTVHSKNGNTRSY